MNAMRCSAFLLFVGLFVSHSVAIQAQSLVDVAKQEQDRRNTVKAAGKTYSNKDLKEGPPPQVVSSGDGSTAIPAPGKDADAKAAAAKPADAEAKAEAKPAAAGAAKAPASTDEEAWRKRMSQAREQLERDRILADALQSRLNSLNTDFVNRDDPAQRAVIATDRDKARTELENRRKAVEDDLIAIESIEDEARRAGVPAGWLR